MPYDFADLFAAAFEAFKFSLIFIAPVSLFIYTACKLER